VGRRHAQKRKSTESRVMRVISVISVTLVIVMMLFTTVLAMGLLRYA
jgi:hypothetical protein